jgi:hypothetical protein
MAQLLHVLPMYPVLQLHVQPVRTFPLTADAWPLQLAAIVHGIRVHLGSK